MTETRGQYDTAPKSLNALKKQYEARGGDWNAALQLIDEATGGKSIEQAIKEGWTVADFAKMLLGNDDTDEAPAPSNKEDPAREVIGYGFTEAPASFNVKAISPKGFDVMLTLRDSDTMALMKRGHKALDWLLGKGYKPTGRRGGGNGGNGGNGNQGEAPLCPTHGKPMKPSQYGGWYCTAIIADDDGTGKPAYCKQNVKE